MYFLQQIRSQFLSNIVNYAGGPEGSGDTQEETIDAPQKPGTDTQKLTELGTEAGEVAHVMGDRAANLEAGAAVLNGDTETIPLTTTQALSGIEFRGEEEAQAKAALGEDATLEQIKQQVFNTRVETLSSNTITSGERELIEADFIAEIAEESGINPKLIGDLRALGFEGSQDWVQGDVAENLESMAEQLKAMKDQIEVSGGEFPQRKEEFLALYEVMNHNDHIDDAQALDPDSPEVEGIDVITNEDGTMGINPEGEGVQVVGDTIIAPDGSYSRGGNVYPAHRVSGSDTGGNISVAQDQLSQIQQPNTSPELEAYNNEHNKEIIKNRVPAEWHGAAIKMAQKIGTIQEGKVISLSSMENKEAIVCYPDGSIHAFPIIIGQNGYSEGTSTGDKKTPINALFNFNSGKVAGRGNDASQGGSSTVLGGAVYSPEAGAMGGRWWHGVADHRIPGGKTHGCIGATQENIMKMARAVNEHGGGYGMNVVTKKG